jgi:hypothetical protein
VTRKRSSIKSLLVPVLATSAAFGIYAFALGPWHRKWGTTSAEVHAAMPGDDLVPDANFDTTRAITIQAGPAQVWPWLAQMGQSRGGLYSYDWLENMMGLDFHSMDHVDPSLQDLKVGDIVALEPSGGGYTVHQLDPNHLLVLSVADLADAVGAPPSMGMSGASSTWTFQLTEIQPCQTRLVCRWRARLDYRGSNNLQTWAIGLLLDPVEFVMEQKMLTGIKERAEALARRPA